ncbi:MAG: HNH endonuclease [Deltaproteobacteria bacterium]|nr:HNH endonuclease [Deltaproteobacteria bacterium]
MDRTLLLSQVYEPITVISWRRAISLLTLGKVEVVETYDQNIRSVSLVLKLPSVVRLVHSFRRHKHPVRFSRQNVLARDRWRCQYCGQKRTSAELTYDHVIPRAKGGKTCWENIVTACVECNARKADRTPEQARMRLLQEPARPSWVPIFTLQISRQSVPDAWRDYCYWMAELVPD